MLGKSKKLQVIDLGNLKTGNRLTGTLPSSIGDLPELQVIIISNNEFYGQISANYGPFDSNLAFEVAFYGNNLSGA